MLLNYQQTKVKAGRIRKYQAILPNKREETIIAQKTKKSSSDNAKKIQWHPAFYAAAELELKENIEELVNGMNDFCGNQSVYQSCDGAG